jgi:hypothetical protein
VQLVASEEATVKEEYLGINVSECENQHDLKYAIYPVPEAGVGIDDLRR